MLSSEMQTLIAEYTVGMMATVNDDGSPAVSPKGTFVIVNDSTIAFGNMRSPGTLSNIRQRPAVEVCFLDVLARKSVRIKGSAKIIRKLDADATLVDAFRPAFEAYLGAMTLFVSVDISAAEMIISPAYDLGLTEQELRDTNLAKLNSL